MAPTDRWALRGEKSPPQPRWRIRGRTNTCANDSSRRFSGNNLKIAAIEAENFARVRSRIETLHVSIANIWVNYSPSGGISPRCLLRLDIDGLHLRHGGLTWAVRNLPTEIIRYHSGIRCVPKLYSGGACLSITQQP